MDRMAKGVKHADEMANIAPTDIQLDVLKETFDTWKDYKTEDGRITFDEFVPLLQEFGVKMNPRSDDPCDEDRCHANGMACNPWFTITSDDLKSPDMTGGFCKHYIANGADVGGVHGLTYP